MSQLRRDTNGSATAAEAVLDRAIGPGRRQPHEEGDPAVEAPPEPTPSAPSLDVEPISPELVLVSPPEVARRARELLPDPPDTLARPRWVPLPSVAKTPAPPPAGRALAAMAAGVLVVVGVVGFVIGREWNGTVPGPAWLPGHTPRVAAAEPASPVGQGHSAHQAPSVPAATQPSAQPPNPAPKPSTTTPSHKPRSRPRTSTAAAAPPPPPPPPPAPTTTASAPSKPSTPAKQPTKQASPPKPAGRKTTTDGKPRATQEPPAGFSPARVFAWAPVPQASGYVVRFFRDGKKVFDQRINRPKLTLPSKFHFTAGHYRWEVRPVVGSRLGAPIVASQFVVGAAD